MELQRIRSLYIASTYAFHITSRHLHKNTKHGSNEALNPVSILHKNLGEIEIAPNAYAFWRRLDSQYPRYLRESLFVRLISAFEVFLILSIQDVFLARRDLFHSDKRFLLSDGELLSAKNITSLWSRIIKKETRYLHSQGFAGIMKYYNRYLNIDFNSLSISTRSLNELHDRRHLLVHRLGKTDECYRHTYNTNRKTVTVDEDFFLMAINHIQCVVEELQILIVGLIEKKLTRSRAWKTPFKLEIELVICDDEGQSLLQDDFYFFAGEDLVSLNTIQSSISGDDNKLKLILEGEKSHLSEYKKLLKQSDKKGHLVLMQIQGGKVTETRVKTSGIK